MCAAPHLKSFESDTPFRFVRVTLIVLGDERVEFVLLAEFVRYRHEKEQHQHYAADDNRRF